VEEDDDEGEESVDKSENANEPIILTPSEVAQAFSHFSYEATGRKRLICDLRVYLKKKKMNYTSQALPFIIIIIGTIEGAWSMGKPIEDKREWA